MNEEEITIHNVRLSFKSFLLFMIIAGFSVALASIFFYIAIASFKLFSGDPAITSSDFIKPLLSIVIDPLDSIISGILIYPIYKFLMIKYLSIDIKLWRRIEKSQ